mmetsp:Transcript_61725/g.177712  ORF Transcript_61725/g.177712 Transcript_61725/m.177712 type:complete len:241 (+) Transcript_61725:141-863(+)
MHGTPGCGELRHAQASARSRHDLLERGLPERNIGSAVAGLSTCEQLDAQRELHALRRAWHRESRQGLAAPGLHQQAAVLGAQPRVLRLQRLQFVVARNVKTLLLAEFRKEHRGDRRRQQHILEAPLSLQSLLLLQRCHEEVPRPEADVQVATGLVGVPLDDGPRDAELAHGHVPALLAPPELHELHDDLVLVAEPVQVQGLATEVHGLVPPAVVDAGVLRMARRGLHEGLEVEAPTKAVA